MSVDAVSTAFFGDSSYSFEFKIIFLVVLLTDLIANSGLILVPPIWFAAFSIWYEI